MDISIGADNLVSMFIERLYFIINPEEALGIRKI
jgi:hypothetical protein